MRIANRRRALSRGPGPASVVRLRTSAPMEQQMARDLSFSSGSPSRSGKDFGLGCTAEQNLDSRAEDARYIRTLTFILSLAGRGKNKGERDARVQRKSDATVQSE